MCGGQDVTVQLTSTTPGVNVTIGDSETLDCRVTNVEPGGDILWYHNGTDLGYIQCNYSMETCILESMLVLSNVTYTDGGTYTCLFRDNVVSATESSTLFVRVSPRGIHLQYTPFNLLVLLPCKNALNFCIAKQCHP